MEKKDNIEALPYFIEATKEIIDQNAYCREHHCDIYNERRFREIDVLYSSTTENFAEYSKYLGDCKSVLTVGGSGDHVLNALAMGAESVSAFDINILAYFGLELKLAAIKTLTIGEYFVFFEKFPYNLFEKMLPVMSDNVRTYWYTIFNYAKENIYPDLFAYIPVQREILKKINLFSDKKVFNFLKERTKNFEVDFYAYDIYDLPTHIANKKFDMINLSNIYEYLNSNFKVSVDGALKYHDFVMSLVDKNLNDKGTILVSYLYNYNPGVRDYIDRMLKTKPHLLYCGGMLHESQRESFYNGFIAQKVAYNYLCDLFDDKAQFNLVSAVGEYGESFDKTFDMALILKKNC